MAENRRKKVNKINLLHQIVGSLLALANQRRLLNEEVWRLLLTPLSAIPRDDNPFSWQKILVLCSITSQVTKEEIIQRLGNSNRSALENLVILINRLPETARNENPAISRIKRSLGQWLGLKTDKDGRICLNFRTSTPTEPEKEHAQFLAKKSFREK